MKTSTTTVHSSQLRSKQVKCWRDDFDNKRAQEVVWNGRHWQIMEVEGHATITLGSGLYENNTFTLKRQ